jgi:hypothetical protein
LNDSRSARLALKPATIIRLAEDWPVPTGCHTGPGCSVNRNDPAAAGRLDQPSITGMYAVGG